MSRAFYRSYVHAGRRAGQVRRLHILREDGPWAGKQGECGIHAWNVTRSEAVVIDPMPATPPVGLEWCSLCVARHAALEADR